MSKNPPLAERTLAILKPDALAKGAEKKILAIYRDKGLRVVDTQRTIIDLARARMLYREHVGRPYFEGLILAICSGPVMIVLLEGHRVVEKVRELHGSSKDPAPGTIRHTFKSAGGPFNMVHASDSSESARQEINLFFSDNMAHVGKHRRERLRHNGRHRHMQA